jgi:hypothetical protein
MGGRSYRQPRINLDGARSDNACVCDKIRRLAETARPSFL